MRLDLVSLRIFLAVVEEGNLTKAAEREHIAASAASKRIQDLEHEFGVRLLTRSIRGVMPTAAGEALARRARGLFGMVGQIRGELDAYAAGSLGEVVVHANGSAIAEFLASDLRAFLAENRQVKVDLHEVLSPEVIRAVNQGSSDLGIFADNVAVPPGLTVHPYRTDRLLAVVPVDHPLATRPSIAFSELLEFEQIGVAEGSSLAQLLRDAAQSLDRPIRFNCTVSTNEVVRWMVDAGFGVAILPEGFVRPYERILRIRGVPLEDPWAHRRLLIAVRDPQTLTRAARNLLAWLTGSTDAAAQENVRTVPAAVAG